MSKDKITIFTPTYNRGYILNRCYESLCKQINNNFEWLIVDDGSIDNTEELVNNWIKANKIRIRYIKQENSGKHIAHNKGVLECNTDIFVCVDSDDYLTDNAIDTIYQNWNKVKTNSKLAGIIALRGNELREPISTRMPRHVSQSSILDLYNKYKFKGDTMLIFRSEILKKYLFPVFEGEKFVTEAVIYDQISKEYKMILLDEVLYIGEYLEDGYSRNIKSIHRKNPNGYMFYLSSRIDNASSFKEKYIAYSNYLRGMIDIKDFRYAKNKNKLMLIISVFRAITIYLKSIIKSRLSK